MQLLTTVLTSGTLKIVVKGAGRNRKEKNNVRGRSNTEAKEITEIQVT